MFGRVRQLRGRVEQMERICEGLVAELQTIAPASAQISAQIEKVAEALPAVLSMRDRVAELASAQHELRAYVDAEVHIARDEYARADTARRREAAYASSQKRPRTPQGEPDVDLANVDQATLISLAQGGQLPPPVIAQLVASGRLPSAV